jgi:hypothetical protein
MKIMNEATVIDIPTLYRYLDTCASIKGLLETIRFSDSDKAIWQSLITRSIKLDALGRNKYAVRLTNFIDFTFDLYKNNIKALSFSNTEKTRIYLETKSVNMEFYFDKDIDMYITD